jgi:hypothetical protein
MRQLSLHGNPDDMRPLGSVPPLRRQALVVGVDHEDMEALAARPGDRAGDRVDVALGAFEPPVAAVVAPERIVAGPESLDCKSA